MSDDFNQYVVIPEAEYKSLLSQVQSQIQSMDIDKTNAPEKSVPNLDPAKIDKTDFRRQQQQLPRHQEREGGDRGGGGRGRGERQEDREAEEEQEQEESRGAAASSLKKRKHTTSSQDLLFEELCTVFDDYFPPKHRSRVISLLRRLSATGHLQIEAGSEGTVRSVTLGAHRYPILDFTDILEIVQTLKSKPELTDTNLKSFVKFLSDNGISKTLVYNPWVRKYDIFLSSDPRSQKSPIPLRSKSTSSSGPRTGKSKKTADIKNKNVHTRLKWYISEQNVSDDSD